LIKPTKNLSKLPLAHRCGTRLKLNLNRGCLRHWSGLAMLAALLLLLGASSVPAQTLQLHLPFTNNVGTTTLSSGDGTISGLALTMYNNGTTAVNLITNNAAAGGLVGGAAFDMTADLTASQGITQPGNGSGAGTGPIIELLNSGTLATLGNAGSVSSFMVSYWVKSVANPTTTLLPRMFVLSSGATATDYNAAGNNMGMQLGGTNSMFWSVGGTTLTGTVSSVSFPVNTWMFFAVTYDGANLVMYYGTTNQAAVQIGTTALAGKVITLSAAASLDIGNSVNKGYLRAWNGWYGDFRFYNGVAGTAAQNLAYLQNVQSSAIIPTTNDTWTAATSTNWDLTTANWTNPVPANTFANGDAVLFNDTAAAFTVNLTTNVSPASLTFSNSANNYTLGSTGGFSIGGPGTLTLAGTGTVTLNNTSTFSGVTTIGTGGKLVIGGAGLLGGGTYAANLTDNGTLNYGSTASQNLTGIISGTGGLTVSGGTLTIGQGTGSTTWYTYTGPTLVTNGTLNLNFGNNPISGIYLSSGLTINNNGIVAALGSSALEGYTATASNLPITINAGGTLTVPNTVGGFSAHLFGVLNLNGGTLAMAGANTGNTVIYGGWALNNTVFVNGGINTSYISDPYCVPLATGGTIFNVASGGTASGVDLDVIGHFTSTSGSPDTGIVKTGNGTMRLNSFNTYSNTTTISNGTLLINNSTGSGTGIGSVSVIGGTLGGSGIIAGVVMIQAGGTLAPGAVTNAAGTMLTISNTLSLAAGSFTVLKVQTGGIKDQAVSSSTLTYGGTLTVTNLGGALVQGDTFKLFTASNYTGSFAVITLPILGSGLVWTNSLSSNGTVAVISGTISPPVVTNLAAASVQSASATLNGRIVATGNQTPTVTLYYGATDGGTTAGSWGNSIVLGTQTGSFSNTITGLSANTTYYYAAAATNTAGLAWAVPSQAFTTLPVSKVVVTNLPATGIQGTAVTLNGQIVSTGGQIPAVTLYYGSTDGGTNAGAWSNSVALGLQGGSFNYLTTGLTTNTAYYYTASATNLAGLACARPSLTFTTAMAAAVSVLTYHNDNARTGANTNETLLTPANVNTNTFGRLFTNNVDGYIFAQPLYVPNLSIPGQGVHNVIFVATEHNSIYAFDADGNGGANGGVIWQTNLGVSAISVFTNGASMTSEFGDRYNNHQFTDLTPEVGITGTPVIDPATGTLYVDVFSRQATVATTNFYHHLHALSLTNGAERPNSPMLVAATYPGTGVDSVGGVVNFNARQHMQRPALTLAGGILFVCYGSYADTDPYHGWVLGFNPTTLQQLTNYIFNTTPNATKAVFGANAAEGAIWMSGNGLCVDANTNLYFETANGSFDGNTGGKNYGDSFIKLATTNQISQFMVADYFTPSNQAALQSADSDLGSGGALLLPDEVGSTNHPHLLVGSAKTRQLYLVDRDNMGTYNGIIGSNRIVQEFTGGTGGSCYSTPAYFNYTLYYAYAKGNPMYAYKITNGLITTTPLSTSANSFNGFGTTPSISANGTSNGIVWLIDPSTTINNGHGSAVLRAYNATNLALQLYNSSQLLTRDNPGNAVKYAVPTVANGKVYVGTEYALSVFGLTTFIATPVILPNGGTYANLQTVTLSDATAGATIYYTLDGTTPTTNSLLYSAPFVVTNTVNVSAVAAKAGSVNSGVAVAAFVNTAAAGHGTGLQGQYWTNTAAAAFTNTGFATAATLTRTDAVVNFDWSVSGPAPTIGTSNYTVRWTGAVQAQYNETYTFTTVADDGVRLWVNGQLLVNDWTAHASPATNSGTITLNSQQLYNIQMDYFQGSSAAAAQLKWGSASTAQAIIPQTQLYPFTNPPPSVALTSPANSATNFTAAASVTLGATADAPYNTVGRVDFYIGGVLLGTFSNSVYGPFHADVTATGLAAGSYTLTAVAVDRSGLGSTSAPVGITVIAGSGQPYGLTNNVTVSAFLNMPATSLGTMPALLSGTGAFGNTTNRTPANGLIPYVPNTPLWSDAALKSRYLALPNNGGLITPAQQIAFAPTGPWTFPAGTVFVKNFDLTVNETNASVPLRRLETRLLVRDSNGQVYGVTYKWRADNSDADLLSGSLSEAITITNTSGVRTQTWYYPSPQDCLTCHTPVANYVLGLNTRQLNGNQTYPATGNTDNQLRTLNRLGMFNPAINEASIAGYAKLSALTNLTASLQERARSYLDANCAQCHQPGGAGITFDARYDTPLASQNITNYPAAVSLGLDNACVVKPKDIWRSVIYARMNSVSQATKMPSLARNLVDTNALQVMGDWINSLPGIPALAPPAIAPNGGVFSSAVTITMTPPDGVAQLYYTTNGTLPTTNSFLYAGPFGLSNSATLMANAFEAGFNNSVAASAAFTVQLAPYFTAWSLLPNGEFQLGVAGVSNKTYILQASTNLINWIPLSTNLATTNRFNLFDPGASNFPSRFYRTLEQ
jgi:uncharacterized repeat protein (TIGR03806 family)